MFISDYESNANESLHGLFDNQTVADALMDRVVHSSYQVELSGESLRKTQGVGRKGLRRKQNT